jgi:HEAT repeat protein
MHSMRLATVGFVLLAVLIWGESTFAQRNAAQIAALDEANLIEIIKDRDAPTFEKAKACQRLAVVGTKNAVPALADLLADQKLNVYARIGLEGIDDPSVDEALREAAQKNVGPQRVVGRALDGVIDSIGKRRDEQAVPLLKRFVWPPDVVRSQLAPQAAIAALGRIGTVECAEALKAEIGKARPAVGDACLACAERLAAAGKESEALDLYKALASSEMPKQIRIAALDGQLRLLKGEAKYLLGELLQSQDEETFRLALAATRRIPGVTESAAALLDKLPPERQALLLVALGDRDEPVPFARIRSAAESKSPQVRTAAITVLAKRGDSSAAGLLLDAAMGDDDLAASAKQGLISLAGDEVDKGVIARLEKATAQQKPLLFDLIAARRIIAAKPAIREAMKSSDEPVQLAAIAAFGQLAELDELDLLLARAVDTSAAKQAAAAQTALRTAALRMSDRERTAQALAEHVKKHTGASQSFLFDVLGAISGKAALDAVVSSAKSSDAATKDAATRVLGDWVNADAAPALLDIAKNDSEQRFRTRALRGYLRIARQLQLPEDERLAMYKTAMELAARDDERKLALDILTRIPSAKTLDLAVAQLDKPALKDTAADAAVKIAGKIVAQEPKSVAEAMQKVASASPGGDVAAKARQLLDRTRGKQ